MFWCTNTLTSFLPFWPTLTDLRYYPLLLKFCTPTLQWHWHPVKRTVCYCTYLLTPTVTHCLLLLKFCTPTLQWHWHPVDRTVCDFTYLLTPAVTRCCLLIISTLPTWDLWGCFDHNIFVFCRQDGDNEASEKLYEKAVQLKPSVSSEKSTF